MSRGFIMAGMKACLPYSKLFVWMLVVWLMASPWLEARVEPTHGFDIFSQEEEIQLGKQNAAEVMKQMPVLPDSDPVSQYVQKRGAKLAARAPGYQWPYSFHVVNVKEISMHSRCRAGQSS
jgi:predicted Zn-dependent protease